LITRTVCSIGLAFVTAFDAGAQNSSNLTVSPMVRAALDVVRADDAQVVEDQVRFCEIPAPPFKETARAQAIKAVFEELGLANVRIDRAGNVLGDRLGVAQRPHLVVAAHLDTVFPEGTDVRVTRDGAVLKGPGIGDNCRGLAALVGTIRALKRANVQTAGSVTFVANVGEEGLGNLRGVRGLFRDSLKGQIDRFLSIDGADIYVANVAVGSRRYRATFRGPGGHSFAAFGTANPIQAMGRAIAEISQLKVPARPKTTFNVGRVSGGTAVNAIPSECWMEIDLRSSDTTALASLDASVARAIDAAVREENERWGTSRAITVSRELVGDRPAGATPAQAPIVQTALAAARALGLSVSLTESSTDASVPIQLGIPAIAIGAGGRGANAHTSRETFDTTDAWRGTQYVALLVTALARP
jgi:tripeptide aminopeptidase